MSTEGFTLVMPPVQVFDMARRLPLTREGAHT